MNKNHLEHIHGLQAAECYGWGSPIGLSIFFFTIVLIAAIIKIVFFGM